MVSEHDAGPPTTEVEEQIEPLSPDQLIDSIRKTIGRVAFELATSPKGRAANLSVEVFPKEKKVDKGEKEEEKVILRAHGGREITYSKEKRDGEEWVYWERSKTTKPTETTRGDLGKLSELRVRDVRSHMETWLGSC